MMLLGNILVTSCSFYVVCVLILNKPGERGGKKKVIHQSKSSTIYTMSFILTVRLRVIVTVVYYSTWYRGSPGVDMCVQTRLYSLFGLPSTKSYQTSNPPTVAFTTHSSSCVSWGYETEIGAA